MMIKVTKKVKTKNDKLLLSNHFTALSIREKFAPSPVSPIFTLCTGGIVPLCAYKVTRAQLLPKILGTSLP